MLQLIGTIKRQYQIAFCFISLYGIGTKKVREDGSDFDPPSQTSFFTRPDPSTLRKGR